MMALLALGLHGALMLGAAPVLAGLLRPRAHPHQAWRDLRRLFRKQALRPEAASWAFAAAPGASFACSLAAALLVPSFTLGMATAPLADLLVLAGLLGLARAAILLAGFEGESGPGFQRAAALRLVADPALLVLVFIVAVATGSSNLDFAGAVLREAGPHWVLGCTALAASAVFVAGEGAAEPLLQFAGRDLAVLHWAAQLRTLTLLSLLAALMLPFGLAPAGSGPGLWVIGAACWAVKMALLGAVATGLGRLRALLRADQAPELAGIGLLLAVLAAALLFAGQRAA